MECFRFDGVAEWEEEFQAICLFENDGPKLVCVCCIE